MEKKNNAGQYLKVTIITVVAALFILGGVFGVIYDKDQLDRDIQKLKTTLTNS